MLPKSDDYDKTRRLGPNQGPGTATAAAVDADALKPGTLCGAYVLKKELASGGGGTVYEASHRILNRRAAVKVLRRQLAASPQMVARFVQEARAVNMRPKRSSSVRVRPESWGSRRTGPLPPPRSAARAP